jgi:uncharacterized membrane protein YkvA (DUF1232 family)
MARNIFFDMALRKASGVLGKPGRVMMLLSKLSSKLRHIKWKEVQSRDIKEKFFVLGRMIKAYVLGQYREIPWKPLLLIAAAVIYFVNPIDLIPDWIPGLGLTDDFGILMTVYASVNTEIEKFLTWEKSNAIAENPL